MTVELDFRTINARPCGRMTVDSDPVTIAREIERQSAATFVHMVGVEGFGIVSVRRHDDDLAFSWVDPGYDPPQFKSGHVEALAWAIQQRA